MVLLHLADQPVLWVQEDLVDQVRLLLQTCQRGQVIPGVLVARPAQAVLPVLFLQIDRELRVVHSVQADLTHL